MSSYKGHIAGGIVAGTLLYAATIKLSLSPTYGKNDFFFAFIALVLGSLFPDIDTKSIGQKIFYTLLVIPMAFAIISSYWTLLASLSALSMFPILVNHRGIIHSFWFVTLFPLLIPVLTYQINPNYSDLSWLAYSYFVTGALSHLVLDNGIIKTFKKLLLLRI